MEFFSALLTVFGSNDIKLSNYIQDAKANGLTVLPPDVNTSEADFKIIDDKTILYGFNTIKSFPQKAAESIINKRPFTTMEEIIVQNSKSEVNKRAVEILAYSGMVDNISGGATNRQDMLNKMYVIRGDGSSVEDHTIFNKRRMLEEEKKSLGVYMSGHPLDGFAKPIDWEEIQVENGVVNGHCILEGIRRIQTKKGDPMAFLELSFMEQNLDAVCFPHLYEKDLSFRKGDPTVPVGELLREGMFLKVFGAFEENFRGELGFILKSIEVPVRANEGMHDVIKEIQEQIGIKQIIEVPAPAPVFSSPFD